MPDLFVPERAASWSYRTELPALIDAARGWRRRHSIAPASEDRARIHLLLVDLQKDFCLPEGGLFVAGREGDGPIGDNRRIAAFIYRHFWISLRSWRSEGRS